MSYFKEFSKDNIIVMSAPNGARKMKQDHPQLPLTVEELADCAESLVGTGVSVLHLHVRDNTYHHTLNVKTYQSAIKAIKERIGDNLILQITTESVGMYTSQQQIDLVKTLKPEAVSLALQEICPDKASELNVSKFFRWLRRERIWPQYILYCEDDLIRFNNMRKRGIFCDDYPFCLFVLGRYSESLNGDLSELESFLKKMDHDDFPWAVCCFGKNEHNAMVYATEVGGHVRIGFENNLYLSDGVIAENNVELIKQYCSSIQSLERKPANADKIRHEFL